MKRVPLRSLAATRLLLLALVVLLSVAGYLVTTETIRGDRESAAARRAAVESKRAEALLGRASALVVGLGSILEGERRPRQRRFLQLAGGISGSEGLVDAMWVERVGRSARTAYERRHGHLITRLTPGGRLEPAPRAASYLVATYTTATDPAFRPGADLSEWSALAAAIDNTSLVFSVTASELGSLARRTGFFLLQAANYGHGHAGYLVLFAPRGWLTSSLQADPRRFAISLDSRHLEGQLRSPPAASAGFSTLARRWRMDVGLPPATGLEALIPWLALAWPGAAALLAFLVARGISRRREAELEVERVFNLSLDLLCIAGFDGYLKRVNPAWERTFGFTEQELLSRPFIEFVHPEDRAQTEAAVRVLAEGQELVEFEDRHLCRDGSARWLEWTSRPVLEQGLVYAVARDVTDRKHIEAEQAALRRVTTLVARAVEPREIFAAVAREMRGLLEADGTRIERHELDGTTTVVASEGQAIEQLPAKIQAPITVEGREWGVTVAAWRRPEQSAAGTELRMAQFTELVAIAIANAESREQLIASRARIVATADDERRRIQRDLHDGAQQRVVTVAVKLKMHAASDAARTSGLDADLVELVHDVNDALRALRDIARGLHPPVLSRGGLPPALRDLAQRSPIPVALDVRVSGRLAKPIEVAAYYAVAEMLTNAAKHAAASRVEVTAEVLDGALRVCVRDDGVGGADQTRGSGLVGLRDRVDALGGTLTLDSPTGGGTTLVARLPLTAAADTAESTDAASTRQPRSAAR